MKQKSFSVTEYSRSKIRIVITCLFVRHSSSPRCSHNYIGRREKETNIRRWGQVKRDGKGPLIDNCDKNVADEK